MLLKNCKIWSIAKKNPGRRGVGAKKTLPFNRGRGGRLFWNNPCSMPVLYNKQSALVDSITLKLVGETSIAGW